MQRCDASVRLAGQTGNTVRKSNISVAEIVILTEIHGEGSLFDVVPVGNDHTQHQDERARLYLIYGERVVDSLFPGKFARLPSSLGDVGYRRVGTKAVPIDDDAAEHVEREVPKPVSASEVGEPASQPEPEDETEETEDDQDDEDDEDEGVVHEEIPDAASEAAREALA